MVGVQRMSKLCVRIIGLTSKMQAEWVCKSGAPSGTGLLNSHYALTTKGEANADL
jgi:hypothetical protein